MFFQKKQKKRPMKRSLHFNSSNRKETDYCIPKEKKDIWTAFFQIRFKTKNIQFRIPQQFVVPALFYEKLILVVVFAI